MSKFDEKMSNFFEVEPIEPEKNLPEKIQEPIPHETLDIDLKKDYEIARENMHELIDKGKDALDDILSIARDSEKGRDFEVAATLLNSLVDANKELLDLNKKIRDIANYKKETKENKTINNTLFVGSTADLNNLVKELKNKNSSIIDSE